jgi:hypothetical protein
MSGFTKGLRRQSAWRKPVVAGASFEEIKSLKGPVPAEYLMAVLALEENK